MSRTGALLPVVCLALAVLNGLGVTAPGSALATSPYRMRPATASCPTGPAARAVVPPSDAEAPPFRLAAGLTSLPANLELNGGWQLVPAFPGVSFDDRRQALALIGGYVYRGQRLPALVGKYVFADFSRGGSGLWTMASKQAASWSGTWICS